MSETVSELPTTEQLNSQIPVERASFKQMKDATERDYRAIQAAEDVYEGQVADRLLCYLSAMDFSNGTTINMLEHSLLTATLAAEDGRCDEYVACALLHDIGDLLCPADHGGFAAAIVRPYVSEGHWFMTRYHPEFQMVHQTANSRADPNFHLRHRDNPHFELTCDFCELYDQKAFDPDAPKGSLQDFVPIIRRVFEKPHYRKG